MAEETAVLSLTTAALQPAHRIILTCYMCECSDWRTWWESADTAEERLRQGLGWGPGTPQVARKDCRRNSGKLHLKTQRVRSSDSKGWHQGYLPSFLRVWENHPKRIPCECLYESVLWLGIMQLLYIISSFHCKAVNHLHHPVSLL